MTKLIYVDDDLPGITRKGAGTGFAYYAPSGALIRDRKERGRLNAIAFPPAYRDAWFCPAPNGHILATGYDDKGRKQYRYHPEFRRQRESDKFDGCLAFGSLLSLIRKRVRGDLCSTQMDRDRILAAVVRTLDRGMLRIGHDHYSKTNGSYGATTLEADHAAVKGARVRLQFAGKGGKQRDVVMNDRELAKLVARLQDLPGQKLFQIKGEGGYRPVTSTEVNDYLRETTGADITAKDFRTWHASVLAFSLVRKAAEPIGLGELCEQVAKRLGNTPAVTRKSYIHPAVIELARDRAADKETASLPRRTQWLTREERGLLELLKQAPAAIELLAA